MIRAAVLLGTLALAALPARADRPLLLKPTRDVAVTYRVTDGTDAQPGRAPHVETVTINYTAAGDRLRIEALGRPAYMLLDRGANRTTVVLQAQHRVLELPFDVTRMVGLDNGDTRLAPQGKATVAGLRCTEYQVHTSNGAGTACLTDDGVLLRAKGVAAERRGEIEATQVAYAPQPAALFAVPADFQRMEMPRISMPPVGSPSR